jgi:hypothetical protein
MDLSKSIGVDGERVRLLTLVCIFFKECNIIRLYESTGI